MRVRSLLNPVLETLCNQCNINIHETRIVLFEYLLNDWYATKLSFLELDLLNPMYAHNYSHVSAVRNGYTFPMQVIGVIVKLLMFPLKVHLFIIRDDITKCFRMTR